MTCSRASCSASCGRSDGASALIRLDIGGNIRAMKRILLICLAALFCTPASALADNGTVISITPSGGQFLGTYSVSVTVPDSVGYYGGFGYAWQVAPTAACDLYNYAGSLVWVG